MGCPFACMPEKHGLHGGTRFSGLDGLAEKALHNPNESLVRRRKAFLRIRNGYSTTPAKA